MLKSSRPGHLLLIVTLMGLMGACAAIPPTATPTPSGDVSPPPASETATAIVIGATSTFTALPPPEPSTATPSPATSTPTSGADTPIPAPATATAQPVEDGRIQFAPGATSAVVIGTLAAGDSATYALAIMADQLLQIDITPVDGVLLTISGADGQVLKHGAVGAAAFRGVVTVSQDYYIHLTPASGAVSYTMNVVIPQTIEFAAGAASATLQGTIVENGSQYYALQVQAGKTLAVDITPADQVSLAVYGLDGTVLASGRAAIGAFEGPVPTTQEYILALRAGAARVSFVMEVTIPAGTAVLTPSAKPIQFAPGATSATVEGTLATGGRQTYTLEAMAGQLMEVNLTPQEGIALAIYGRDGEVLKNSMSEGAFFRGTLPTTQVYVIDLASSRQEPVSLTMSVIIPERIQFAAGATSATMEGTVGGERSHDYILGAGAGQEMEVTVMPEGAFQLVIYGLDGTVLSSGMGEGSTFRGLVPVTQDYVLSIRTPYAPASFTLQVTIR